MDRNRKTLLPRVLILCGVILAALLLIPLSGCAGNDVQTQSPQPPEPPQSPEDQSASVSGQAEADQSAAQSAPDQSANQPATGTVTEEAPAASDAPTAPAGALPRLVDFGSKDCVPCQRLAPIIAGLKRDYAGRFEVEYVDVNLLENRDRVIQVGLTSVPTLILYDANGRQLDRQVGFKSRQQILDWWKQHGYDFDKRQ